MLIVVEAFSFRVVVYKIAIAVQRQFQQNGVQIVIGILTCYLMEMYLLYMIQMSRYMLILS